MRRPPVIATVIAALIMWACARAYVPLTELGAYDGVYTLSGAGPPDRIPLKGTLTIAHGNYVLDTSLGTCKKQPLRVPKEWFGPIGYDTIQNVTKFACGDLDMNLFLSHGQVSGGAGSYFTEKRVTLPPVCVSIASDSTRRRRGASSCSRADSYIERTEHSYNIRVERKL